MTSRQRLTPSQRGILISLAAAVILAGIILAALMAFRSTTDDPVAATTTLPPATTAAPATPTTTTPPVATTVTAPEETTTTSTTVPETTTTTIAIEDSFVLRPEGIDRMFFGADPEEVIDELTERLGDPTEDTDWVDQLLRFDGLCGGTDARFVTWDNLTIFLTDRGSEWAPEGTRHFESYSVTEGPAEFEFLTSEGVGVGSTRTEVEAAYGDDVSFEDHPIFEEIFILDPPGAGYLYGSLTGLDDDDRVVEIVGGVACGE